MNGFLRIFHVFSKLLRYFRLVVTTSGPSFNNKSQPQFDALIILIQCSLIFAGYWRIESADFSQLLGEGRGGGEGGTGELIGCNQLILTLNYERANLSKGRNASFTFLLLVKLEWKQITDYHFLFYQIECKITSAG